MSAWCSRSFSGSLSVSASTSVYPAWDSPSPAPRTIGGKNGFVMSGTSIPIVNDRLVLSPRATRFTRYPRASAASRTRSMVCGLTMDAVRSLSAREAVPVCTPAAFATSFRLGRRMAGFYRQVGGRTLRAQSFATGRRVIIVRPWMPAARARPAERARRRPRRTRARGSCRTPALRARSATRSPDRRTPLRSGPAGGFERSS